MLVCSANLSCSNSRKSRLDQINLGFVAKLLFLAMSSSLDLEIEGAPLLPDSPIHSTRSEGTQGSHIWPWFKSKAAALNEFWFHEETPILLCTFTLYFLASFAKHIIEVPFIGLLERTICNQYYRTHGDANVYNEREIAERLCKVVPVQNKLANVTGWKFSFDAMPGKRTFFANSALLIET